MVKEKEIPKGYKLTELGVIPEDWEVKRLNEVSKVVDSLHKTPDFVKNGVAMVRVIDIKSGKLNLEKTLRVNEKDFREFVRNYTPKKGDIVLSRVGSYGVSSFVETSEPFCMGQNTVIISPKISNKYLYYFINSKSVLEQIEAGSFGTGYKSLSLKNINELKLQVPENKIEQTNIATALSDMDELIGNIEKLILKKTNIQQGAMHELLTGKKRLPGFNGEWEEKDLGDIVDVKDGTHQTPKYFNSGIPFYSVESVTNNDFANTKYISEEEHRILTKKFKIEEMDILMTRIGSIGDCKLIDWKPNASFYVSLALLKPKNKLSAPYIYQFSKTSFFKKEMVDRSLQWAIPKKINLGEISKVKVSMPKDINEQIATAKILSDMDTEIEALERKRNKYFMLKQGMMEQLLTGKIRIA